MLDVARNDTRRVVRLRGMQDEAAPTDVTPNLGRAGRRRRRPGRAWPAAAGEGGGGPRGPRGRRPRRELVGAEKPE